MASSTSQSIVDRTKQLHEIARSLAQHMGKPLATQPHATGSLPAQAEAHQAVQMKSADGKTGHSLLPSEG
jgi:hypothetical protein